MDSLAVESRANDLVNYTTSIPSSFAKESVDQSRAHTARVPDSPKREARDINIVLNKNLHQERHQPYNQNVNPNMMVTTAAKPKFSHGYKHQRNIM